MTTKTLVTGAGGCIGSHLVERLVHDGARVKALVHYNARNSWGNLEYLPREVLECMTVAAGDLTDSFFVSELVRGVNVVFHLGALIAIPYSYLAPSQFIQTNVNGALNVLDACKRHGIERMIHTSTSEVYGTARYVPMDEKHPLQAQSPYSASKIAADMLADSFYRSFDLPVCTVRPFNAFDPRQSVRAVIPTIISQLLNGKQAVKLGSLTPKRSFNYVTDIVDGFIRAAACDDAVGQVINIGTQSEISIGDLFEKITHIMGVKAEPVVDTERIRPEKSEVERLLCDSTKAGRLLGWHPRVSLEQGLESTIDWISRNQARYKPGLYNV